MNNPVRQDRIERLLNELKYELERGFMEGEIEDESMGFQFVIPISRTIADGVVYCQFRTRPVHRHSVIGMDLNLLQTPNQNS